MVLTALLLSALPVPTKAQILIDTTQTVDYLVNDILLGQGVLVGNVKFTGNKHAIGLYQDESALLGMTAGILLTSGHALYVPGPNKTSRSGWASDAPGDVELDDISKGKTYDAAVLEFDFATQSENLAFEYIFASEEYPEYVGSKFNDVFAFFLQGPEMHERNIALLPDDQTPITVNTVNNEVNSHYFKDNAYTNTSDPFIWDVRNRKVIANKFYGKTEVTPAFNIQFDGFTTILTARYKVIPNKIYHIKIAIADVGDGILDSGVILKGGSFRSFGKQMVRLSNHFPEKVVPLKTQKKSAKLKSNQLLTRSLPREIKIGNVEFDFDRYTIKPASQQVLSRAILRWSKNRNSQVHIIGHTDSWGSDKYNITLSKHRCNAVATALTVLGIPEKKIVIHHFGESRPLLSNLTEYGRARNRRVEIVLIGAGPW